MDNRRYPIKMNGIFKSYQTDILSRYNTRTELNVVLSKHLVPKRSFTRDCLRTVE